jgi:3-hydroxyacyl-[acyl-carrier-protein] dehydratase
MRIHVTKVRRRGSVWKFKGEARVEGTTVADATFSAMIRDDT